MAAKPKKGTRKWRGKTTSKLSARSQSDIEIAQKLLRKTATQKTQRDALKSPQGMTKKPTKSKAKSGVHSKPWPKTKKSAPQKRGTAKTGYKRSAPPEASVSSRSIAAYFEAFRKRWEKAGYGKPRKIYGL